MKKFVTTFVVSAVVMFALFGAGVITKTVKADTSDVTTRWIVPADTTIAISYPNGESLIEFNAAGKNFTDLAASSQTGENAALRVTNNGNTAVEIEFNWTAEWPSGVEYVNISIEDDTNSTSKSFSDADETVKQTMVASLADGDTEDFWFWTTGTDVDETAGVDRSLRITSSNA